MATATNRGRFVWYDLLTSDSARAIEFYTKVVGWGTQVWEAPGGPSYTMWTAGGAPIGGIMPFPPSVQAGTAPHWLAYVSVPDVDETAKQVAALGGKVLHQPMSIPDVGRFMTLADPQGAVIAAYTPANPMPGTDGMKVGEFSWHELTTTDNTRAFDFYSALFGWERRHTMDMGAMGTYQMYGDDERDFGGMFNLSPGMPAAPYWMLYVTVDDADAAVERVKANGGKVMNGPMDVPGGNRVAQCMDPSGAVFAVNGFPKAG
ncbi:MAG TPA: VOC family protein [Candidatus Elarobacter sp.]|nr:VOC family protein [Candidatus Elarobacter sp.]